MVNIPLFIGFHTGGAGFSHQQYVNLGQVKWLPFPTSWRVFSNLFLLMLWVKDLGKKIPRAQLLFFWGGNQRFFCCPGIPPDFTPGQWTVFFLFGWMLIQTGGYSGGIRCQQKPDCMLPTTCYRKQKEPLIEQAWEILDVILDFSSSPVMIISHQQSIVIIIIIIIIIIINYQLSIIILSSSQSSPEQLHWFVGSSMLPGPFPVTYPQFLFLCCPYVLWDGLKVDQRVLHISDEVTTWPPDIASESHTTRYLGPNQ